MAITTITDFTTYATIRGLLGVSAEEIEDTDLAVPMYFTECIEVFETLSEDLLPLYEATKVEPSPTATQKRLLGVMEVYAGCIVASRIANGSLELFSPKKLTDSKASMERTDDPFDQLRADLLASLSFWRSKLVAILGILDPTIVVGTPVDVTYIINVGLASDPVTGV